MPRKTIYVTLIAILTMGAASAQMPKPGVTLKDDKPSRTKQQKEYDRAIDRAYQSKLKEIPEQKKSDPRGDIRSTPPAAATKNKQQ